MPQTCRNRAPLYAPPGYAAEIPRAAVRVLVPLITTRAADACVCHVLVQHGDNYEIELGFGLVGGFTTVEIGDADETDTFKYSDDTGARAPPELV